MRNSQRLLTTAAALVLGTALAGFTVGSGAAAGAPLSMIVFVGTKDGNGDAAISGETEIYVTSDTGGAVTRLTTNGADDGDPAWSPDGTKIAFASGRDGDLEIYVMNADGSGQTRLTTTPGPDFEPTWSPDGTKIAFTSTRGGTGDIYVMSANGGAQTKLTNHPGDDEDADWSTAGILFTSARDGDAEIYAMNADGTNVRQLTANGAADYDAAWSPTATRIAFVSARDAVHPPQSPTTTAGEIYLMNADGTGVVRHTTSPDDESEPTWDPLGGALLYTSLTPDLGARLYTVGVSATEPSPLSSADAAREFSPDKHAGVGGPP